MHIDRDSPERSIVLNVQSRIRIVLVLILLASTLLPAASLEELLPHLSSGEIDALRAQDMLEGYSFRTDLTRMAVPGSVFEENLLRSLDIENSFTVMSLSYIDYPAYMDSMTQEEKLLRIYNTIRSISTQEGIQYISYRAGNKPRTLIEKSWYVKDEDSRKDPIDDPVSSSVPPSSRYTAYQKDSRFGGNVYRHEYTTSGEEIFLTVKNLDTMKVMGIFVAVKEEQLEISLAVHQSDEGLLLSAMATIIDREPKVNILGFKVDLPSSFTRRTTALGNWFKDRIQIPK